MKKWKVLEETDVSLSKWFPVLRQTVELPNGKIIEMVKKSEIWVADSVAAILKTFLLCPEIFS